MKLIKITAIVFLGFVLLINSSCKKTFFTNANNNPNAPATMIPSLLLPTIEGSLAYAQGGDMSRFASMMVQQTYGASRQSQAYYQYIYTNQDVNNLWTNIYNAVMINIDSLMVPSDAKGYNTYSGVSRVLMAYTLMITVDCWGSIPYSQALQGAANLSPAYDNDNDVYSQILKLCNDGITKLSDTTAGALVPSSDDVMYGGNPASWIKFAHAIKARYYMHQSRSGGAGVSAMYQSALTELGQSFASNADNASYPFDTKETFANPWYQFNEQRDDISFRYSTMNTMMSNLNDPRIWIINDTLDPNSPTDGLGPQYGAINSPVEFITYEETQFMTAEAQYATGGTVAAKTAYLNGMAASMQKLGVDSASAAIYIAANSSLTSANYLQQIASQEYISLYLNPEAWVLWRRTGYPALTPVAGSNVPRRLLYPQSELDYNAKNTPAATLFTPKIFWDK